MTSVSPIPEIRAMVAAARQFVDGEIDFLALRGPVLECQQCANRFNVDANIQRLTNEWAGFIERTWDEWGINPDPMPVEELRDRIAADLGDT
ncbi:MAG: hypothetical protein ABJZ55_01355 [Fuerstiella sp.]